MIQFLYHGPFFDSSCLKAKLYFFTYPYNFNNCFPRMSAKNYTSTITKVQSLADDV